MVPERPKEEHTCKVNLQYLPAYPPYLPHKRIFQLTHTSNLGVSKASSSNPYF